MKELNCLLYGADLGQLIGAGAVVVASFESETEIGECDQLDLSNSCDEFFSKSMCSRIENIPTSFYFL